MLPSAFPERVGAFFFGMGGDGGEVGVALPHIGSGCMSSEQIN